MNDSPYPWAWARWNGDAPFTVRMPWFEKVRAAASVRKPLAVVFPHAAGSTERWYRWMWGALEHERLTSVLSVPPDPKIIEDYFDFDPPTEVVRGSRLWAESLLRTSQRRLRMVEPDVAITVAATSDEWAWLECWQEAQESTGVELFTPIIVCDTPPRDRTFSIVRFGAPELLGNLHGVHVSPEADPEFWTAHYLALAVIWECGGLPQAAEELWTLLKDELPSFDRPHFDQRLQDKMKAFSVEIWNRELSPVPWNLLLDWMRRPPPAETNDPGVFEAWHNGLLTWYNGELDLTPLMCRAAMLRTNNIDPDTREILRRRRLVNGPVARWLAAWGATIEESLRLLVLRIGVAKFEQFLSGRPPYDRARFGTRCQELATDEDSGSENLVGRAAFKDLTEFIAAEPYFRGGATMLRECRIARNAAVHDRECSATAIHRIIQVVHWLARERVL